MSAPTAGRETRIRLNIGETTVSRQGWSLTRSGNQIGWHRRQVPDAAPYTHDVLRTGGDTYILKPKQTEFAQTAKTAVVGDVPAADVNLATAFAAVPYWKKITDITGIGADASLATNGLIAFLKRATASVDWSTLTLAADLAAFPGPTADLANSYPLDRVIQGKVSYVENQPFMLKWGHPREWQGTDAFLQFYFGGAADAKPTGSTAGEWCLTLRGGGVGLLQERKSDGTWAKRHEFQWSDGNASSNDYYIVTVIPHGRNRMAILSGAMWAPLSQGFALHGMAMSAAANGLQAPHIEQHCFSESYADSGHYHTQHMSGAGIIRGDIRRDFRIPLTIVKCAYPATTDDETGVIVDAPFQLRENYPADTVIVASVDAFVPANTSVAIALYDAETHTALSTNSDGDFLTVANQTLYYAVFTLSSTNGEQTPLLRGYTLTIAESYRTQSTTPTVLYPRDFRIDGPDEDPTHERASLNVTDLTGTGTSLLGLRDRVRSTVSIYTSGSLYGHLFEGETCQPEAQPHLHSGEYSAWRDYPDLRMVGLWARVADQFIVDPEDFSQDKTASPDVNQQYPPWKVTSIIRKLLNNYGFADAELDIPDLPIRLFNAAPFFTQKPDDYLLLFGADGASLIKRLAHDYLGLILLRDPNAGAAGKWRLVTRPVPPYTSPLFKFVFGPQVSGKVVSGSGAYNANTTFIRKGTFKSWLQAPECNIVIVHGVRNDGSGPALLTQSFRNEASISDPTSIDYLGRAKPVVFPPDPQLMTQEAVDWACRTIYDYAAHAWKYCRFDAPLVMVTNASDTHQTYPRPLRARDLIYVDGSPWMVRSCDLHADRDPIQFCTIEAEYLPT